jgi:N-carbamoyl-L-amino-acid hydrolase
MKLHIDGDRLWGTLMEMGQVGREGDGVNRLALNDANKEGRDLFTGWLRDEGLEVRVDRIGNIFGVREGTDRDEPPVLVGSHLDTVREAGVFDGALGVLSGLEIVRMLNQEDVETKSRRRRRLHQRGRGAVPARHDGKHGLHGAARR